ncbi:MAG: hypothetical protein ACI8RZ_002623, partial [Myxococcota bacterium]
EEDAHPPQCHQQKATKRADSHGASKSRLKTVAILLIVLFWIASSGVSDRPGARKGIP